jgi:hypothetical protein
MLAVILNGRRRLDTFHLRISGVVVRLQILVAPSGRKGETTMVLSGEKDRLTIWSVSVAYEVPAHCRVDRDQILVRFDGVRVAPRIPSRIMQYSELPQFREAAKDFAEYRKQKITDYDDRYLGHWLLLYGVAGPPVRWGEDELIRTLVMAKLLFGDK